MDEPHVAFAMSWKSLSLHDVLGFRSRSYPGLAVAIFQMLDLLKDTTCINRNNWRVTGATWHEWNTFLGIKS